MKQLLASIFGFRRPRHDEDQASEPETRHAEVQTPRMLLLVRDASSIGAYQLHSFDDESAASEFVQFWFPPGFEHGALALWIGHEQGMQLPGSVEKRAAEVVVLIHDAADFEIVHPFSMPDMELARAWLREERQSGLDLREASLYWAARAEIYRDARGRPRFRPVELPAYQTHAEEPEEEPAGAADTAATRTRIVRKDGDRPADAPADGSDATADPPEPQAVSKALRAIIRGERWERKDEPFSTFGSPPGRF